MQVKGYMSEAGRLLKGTYLMGHWDSHLDLVQDGMKRRLWVRPPFPDITDRLVSIPQQSNFDNSQTVRVLLCLIVNPSTSVFVLCTAKLLSANWQTASGF